MDVEFDVKPAELHEVSIRIHILFAKYAGQTRYRPFLDLTGLP